MPCPLLIVSQSDPLIQIVDIDSHTKWQTADSDQLASSEVKKPTDLDLHCLQRQGISRFSRTRVKPQHKEVPCVPNQKSDQPAYLCISVSLHFVLGEVCGQCLSKSSSEKTV